MFRFSITDLATFLGKSPVTLRAWERKGFMTFPRAGRNRCLSIDQVRDVAAVAYRANRISQGRLMLINESLTTLSFIEIENS